MGASAMKLHVHSINAHVWLLKHCEPKEVARNPCGRGRASEPRIMIMMMTTLKEDRRENTGTGLIRRSSLSRH
jgi:hypothetical protein